MNAKYGYVAGAALFGLSTLIVAHSAHNAAAAETGKPVKITRLYTGADGQTHAQEIEVKFGAGGTDPFKLAAGAGAEIRRAPPGRVADWHVAPCRVIRAYWGLFLRRRLPILLAAGDVRRR